MKFSVASRIWEPDAPPPAGWPEGVVLFGRGVLVWAWEDGSAIVAGRLTRRRSVARGHSICHGKGRSGGRING